MWVWWIGGASASAATVVSHRCSGTVAAATPACRCLTSDPDGPNWWGGIVEPPDVTETCFDVDQVLLDSGDDRLRAPLESLAGLIALGRGYRWTRSYGLVSQEDKTQLADLGSWAGVGPVYTVVGLDGKDLSIDTGGRSPARYAVWIDGEGLLADDGKSDDGGKDTGGKDTGDAGSEAPRDDLLALFTSGEVWVILGPDGQPIVFPPLAEPKP
ncbi:MAG: hypothetical protein ABMB14_18585 [Myxococcota bacterium]